MNQNGKGQDNFQTPKHIFKQLNRIFNFTHDVACCTYNMLCQNGMCFDLNDNGLLVSWKDLRCFCNPPFSTKADWIKKADNEVQNNNCPICVMILPSLCMSTDFWHDYIEGKYLYEVLRQRISFIDPKTNKPKNGNNSGTVIVYFKKYITTKEAKK